MEKRKETNYGRKSIAEPHYKLQEIEAQKELLEKEAEKIRQEIKMELETKQVEELAAGPFMIRWKTVLSSRLDGKALKAALPEIYRQYCKSSTTRRFTIA